MSNAAKAEPKAGKNNVGASKKASKPLSPEQALEILKGVDPMEAMLRRAAESIKVDDPAIMELDRAMTEAGGATVLHRFGTLFPSLDISVTVNRTESLRDVEDSLITEYVGDGFNPLAKRS